MPYLGEALASALLFVSLAFVAGLVLLALHHLRRPVGSGASLALITVIAVMPTAAAADPPWLSLAFAAAGAAMLALTRKPFRRFHIPGRIVLVTQVATMFVGTAWGLWFITSIDVSNSTRALMLLAFPLVVLTIMPNLVQALEQWEVLCRRDWARPRDPLPPRNGPDAPMVSIHVPTHAEPPEVVIQTLNALARLNYDRFEVLVLDNNTKDEALWRPLEEHCRNLGERFRFFHLENWPGAKAGALNFAMTRTDPQTRLISVIDADYHAEPDFLADLVGYFDDPKLGFVQTPHDYRDWESSTYLRMCYWEYKYFFWTNQISRNERDAAITVGTMCIIRRAVLEQAGGWAEWCATEDSELSVRIHALGYSSIYVAKTYGRGLIPDTFEGYKKQRFRWTYGPVQTLKHHLRLFTGRSERRHKFTAAQWLHHVNHGLDRASIGLGLLLLPLAVAVLTSIAIHGDVIPIPPILWIVAPVAFISSVGASWLTYRIVMGASVRDFIGAVVAMRALGHTVTMASLWALVTRTIPWRRTSKFKPHSLGPLDAIRSAKIELTLGVITLLVAGVVMLALRPQGLVLMLLAGAVLQSLNYFAAPAAALFAARHVRAQQDQPRVDYAERPLLAG